ncbi:hypothetical protein HanRHA438_Chr05g0238861 [Helianthus annuus]|nr:hypothetical protein HanRHA438_Chr05g0238861 [Helianthus annuus]
MGSTSLCCISLHDFLTNRLGQRVRKGTCHFGRELGRQRDGHMEYVSTTYGSRWLDCEFNWRLIHKLEAIVDYEIKGVEFVGSIMGTRSSWTDEWNKVW